MKHIFKLLKTSWGIVVLIDVEEIIDEKVLLYDIAITDTADQSVAREAPYAKQGSQDGR